MSSFSARLKDFAKRKYGGISAMADKIGLSQPALSNYTSERNEPGPVFWDRLRAAGISSADLSWLMFGEVTPTPVKEPPLQYEPTGESLVDRTFGQLYPLVSIVSAGNGGSYTIEQIELIPGPKDSYLAGSLYLEVVGDSMENRWEEGDLVLVNPRSRPAHGEYAVVGWNSEDAALKRIYYVNGKIELHSLNPRYKPIIVDPDTVWFLGAVVSTIHRSQRGFITRIKKES